MKYQIVCHDKKTFEITEEQKEVIYRLSGSNAKGVDVKGEYIFFSNIARIEKAPGDDYQELPMLQDVISNFSDRRRKRALENIIRGFKNHFKGREIPRKAQDMLKAMITRLETQ